MILSSVVLSQYTRVTPTDDRHMISNYDNNSCDAIQRSAKNHDRFVFFSSGELVFPHVNLAMYGGQAFAYAGPTSWNSLPDSLKNINLTLQTSNAISRPSYFPHTSTFSAFEVLTKTRYINPLLLTIRGYLRIGTPCSLDCFY